MQWRNETENRVPRTALYKFSFTLRKKENKIKNPVHWFQVSEIENVWYEKLEIFLKNGINGFNAFVCFSLKY